jgi:hypothetical protein
MCKDLLDAHARAWLTEWVHQSGDAFVAIRLRHLVKKLIEMTCVRQRSVGSQNNYDIISMEIRKIAPEIRKKVQFFPSRRAVIPVLLPEACRARIACYLCI